MKRKLKKTCIVIQDRTLKNNLNVFLNYTFEELNKALKKQGTGILSDKYKDSEAITFVPHKGAVPYFTIWIPDFKWVLWQQAVLGHEIIHAIFAMLDYKGIPIEKPEETCNETFAYLFEFFFLEANRAIFKLKM
jgi:hypothetical protein